MNQRILIVDDDTELCELLVEYLGSEGFSTDVAYNGLDGVNRVRTGPVDVVILDSMLPGLGGMEVLRRVRAINSVPIIMLTANASESDRILGLEIGADDYMHKPFNPRELVVRIRAILRRMDSIKSLKEEPNVITVDDLVLDPMRRQLTQRGVEVVLTSVEFDLLHKLISNPGAILKRTNLTEEVLGRKHLPYERSIDVHVSNLRKKIGTHKGNVDRIVPIRGIGYLYRPADEVK